MYGGWVLGSGFSWEVLLVIYQVSEEPRGLILFLL